MRISDVVAPEGNAARAAAPEERQKVFPGVFAPEGNAA